MGGVGDFVHRAMECRLVCVRRLGESGQLPDELQRRRADFLFRRARLKIMQGLDVSAHEESLTADHADENGFSFLSTINSQPSTIWQYKHSSPL